MGVSMKLVRLLIPRLEIFTLRKIARKKVFAALIAALALPGAAINPARDLHSSIKDETAGGASISAPVGLTRTRPDFTKAIDMLADAAAGNRHLADYYDSLTRRVKGDSSVGASYSGINVLRRVRKPRSPRIDPPPVALIAAADAGGDVTPAGLDAYLEGAVTPESLVEPVNPSGKDLARSQSDSATRTPPAFTVGDMAFDTNPAIEHWMNYY